MNLAALANAVHDKPEDGTFAGRTPRCKEVVAFGPTLRECENELRSTLEDWILVGRRLGYTLPVITDDEARGAKIREPIAPGRGGRGRI
jgi:predicted RNase H-like HicB family nuclease